MYDILLQYNILLFKGLKIRVKLQYWNIWSFPEPLGGVRNLQVMNPTMTTLNVRWEPAEGKVKEYKVIYVPEAGGAETMVGLVGLSACCWCWVGMSFLFLQHKSRNSFAFKIKLTNICYSLNEQEQVSGTTTTTVLRALQPDTLYSVTVYPVYADGDGQRMSENGKTSEFSNYCH